MNGKFAHSAIRIIAAGILALRFSVVYAQIVIPKQQQGKLVPDNSSSVMLFAEVDKAIASTSDIITFTITMDRDKGIQPIPFPDIGSKIEGFRIIEFNSDQPEMENHRVIEKRWFKLQADISGSYVIPSVRLKYKDFDGVEKTAETSEIFIEIQSPGGQKNGDASSDLSQATDIRDIKEPELVPFNRNLLYALGGLALVLCSAAGLWFYIMKRKKITDAIIRTPYERALERLDVLKNSNFLKDGKTKDFHFILSEVIRTYLEDQFFIPATDRTTDELKRELVEFNEISAEMKNEYMVLLTKTDMVKFTDQMMNDDDSMQLLFKAEDFVMKTCPTPVAVSEEDVI